MTFDLGIELENIKFKLTLATLKPLHATWIIEFYNRM